MAMCERKLISHAALYCVLSSVANEATTDRSRARILAGSKHTLRLDSSDLRQIGQNCPTVGVTDATVCRRLLSVQATAELHKELVEFGRYPHCKNA